MRPIRAIAGVTAAVTALLAAGCASAPTPPTSPTSPVSIPAKQPAPITPIVGAGHSPGDILHTWTQLVQAAGFARVVVAGQGQACPEITLDDQPPVRMTERPNPFPGQASYPITVCEHPLRLPDGRPARRAQVADRLLPLPGGTPARIAVISDIGDIGDIGERIVRTVARRQSPTLVIHVGDYRRREAGSPDADNWEGWEDDFFKPAEELLQVAPWLMSPGRPEDCGEDGARGVESRGWAYLLDPHTALPASDPSSSADAAMAEAVDNAQTANGLRLNPGFVMLVRNDAAKAWQATWLSPKGEETRPCRLQEGKLDCGFPAVEPCP